MKKPNESYQHMHHRLPQWNAMIGFPDRSPDYHPINYPSKRAYIERGHKARSSAFHASFHWIKQQILSIIAKYKERKLEQQNQTRLRSMGQTALKDISAVLTTSRKSTVDLACPPVNENDFNRCA